MKKLQFIFLIFTCSFGLQAGSGSGAGWFVGGLGTGVLLSNMSQPRQEVYYVEQPTRYVEQQPIQRSEKKSRKRDDELELQRLKTQEQKALAEQAKAAAQQAQAELELEKLKQGSNK